MNDISELDSTRWGKKPHIYFFNGYWRVTPCPVTPMWTRNSLDPWIHAHEFITRWNNAAAQYQKPSPARQRLMAAWGGLK